MSKYFILFRQYFLHIVSFFVPLIFFILTLSPTVNFGDTGELITAAATLGIPHPPGSPIWVALVHLFTYIPVSSIAYRVNLSSAFFVAASSLVLYILTLDILNQIIKKYKNHNPYESLTKKQLKRQRDQIEKFFKSQNGKSELLEKFAPLITLTIVLVYSFTFPILSHAVYTEVYPLNTLFYVIILFFVTQFIIKNSVKYLYASMFIFGLAITNHYLILLAFPTIFIAAAVSYKNVVKPKVLFTSFIVFLLGLSFFLFLLIRSKANPPIDWGNPENLTNFLSVIQRKQFDSKQIFQTGIVSLPIQKFAGISDFVMRIFQSFYTLFKIVTQAYTYLLAAVGLIGIYAFYRYHRKFFILFMTSFLATGAGFAFLTGLSVSANDKMTPFLPALLSFAVFIAIGIAYIFKYITRISYFILAFPIYFIIINFNAVDMHPNTIAYDHARLMLKLVSKNAIIFTEENNWLFPLAYLQIVEKQRPDVTIYDRNGNIFNDIYKEARNNYRYESEFERKRREIENQILSTSNSEVYYAVDKTFENYKGGKISREGILYKIGSPRDVDFGEYYKEILSIDDKNRPGFWDAEYMVAYYHMQYADNLIEHTQSTKAFEELKKAQNWGRNDYRMLNNIGIYYLRLKNYDGAKDAFQEAIKINPDYYIGYTNLGYVNEVLGETRLAEENYIKALTINETYFTAIYRLASFYEVQGSLEKAIYGYRLALRLDPENKELAQHIKELEDK